MSFYRWILFPLICAVLLTITLGISFAIVGIPLVSLGLLLGFVLGAIMGLSLQIYNDYKTKKYCLMLLKMILKLIKKDNSFYFADTLNHLTYV
jgi:hypothetical protein